MKNRTDISEIKSTISSVLNDEAIYLFKIYLFGSRARKNFTLNSDYDILIELNKKLEMKEKIKLFTRLRRILAKKRFNVDIVIKTREEVNYYKNKIGHIVRAALNEGILL